jgi:hypothetical protein
MNIAIIGPPGSQKSKLAKMMKNALESEFQAESTVVIDNYAQQLKRDTNLALGAWSSWSENFMVAGYRRARELKARQNMDNSITVGSILDSLYYTGMTTKNNQSFMAGDPSGLGYVAGNAAMGGMALWFRSDWDYNLAFIKEPEGDKHDPWVLTYSYEIGSLGQELMIPGLYRYPTLEDFDAKIFTNVVRVAKDAEQRVRSGGGNSESIGQASVNVSNLSSS